MGRKDYNSMYGSDSGDERKHSRGHSKDQGPGKEKKGQKGSDKVRERGYPSGEYSAYLGGPAPPASQYVPYPGYGGVPTRPPAGTAGYRQPTTSPPTAYGQHQPAEYPPPPSQEYPPTAPLGPYAAAPACNATQQPYVGYQQYPPPRTPPQGQPYGSYGSPAAAAVAPVYGASTNPYPTPAGPPPPLVQASVLPGPGAYQVPQVYGQGSYAGYPPTAHTAPKKYAPKRHSQAQDATLAAMKPLQVQGQQGQKPQQQLQHQPQQAVAAAPAVASGSGGGLFSLFKPRPGGKPTDVLSSFTGALQTSLHDYARTLFPASSTHSNPYFPSAASADPANPDLLNSNRYNSFAPMRTSIRHNPKWYVDGKDYMYAVSCALEKAKHTIWIMDWWLSPELNLRRPASRWTFPGDPPGGRYRLDNMLAAAAARGVEVKVIVYKEVEAALTLNSHYTKKALEARGPNIAVMRHPDHVPDATNTLGDIVKEMKDGYNLGDLWRGLYGMKDGKVLFWAHHEKMVLVDAGWGEGQEKGFMGGLDLCFGRWDTNEHPLADVHENVEGDIFLGQDYNNARIMDFHSVYNWSQNKLDRAKFSRMGWTDVALSLQGPILKDMARHFIQRWNYIFDQKYHVRLSGGERYKKLPTLSDPTNPSAIKKVHNIKEKVKVKYGGYSQEGYGAYTGQGPATSPQQFQYNPPAEPFDDTEGLGDGDGVRCQLLRSASRWSHGTTETEHSICNAYIESILAAEHFVYIENQFFITATAPEQRPIINLIGAAIVERIMRAYTSRQPFKMIIVIPAVPGFAGDLQDEGSLGTRAIMEFQYRSICRDRGYSILEQLAKQGIPKDLIGNYIRFYNLRNYDRINYVPKPKGAEAATSGAPPRTSITAMGVGYGPYSSGVPYGRPVQEQPKQTPAPEDQFASIARCAMLGGGDIREVPWHGPPEMEVDAIVSEELYIHSKLLIADDRRVICGSANLNDRSQLGDHDSEIAIMIEDPTPLPSTMAGKPYIASHFAGTLRRQIFRKHLGLIPAQDLNFLEDDNLYPSPVPNVYDFDSEEDRLVTDPLGPEFTQVWDEIARTNTECFRQVFRPVPDEGIHNWKQYEEWFSSVFKAPKAARMKVAVGAEKKDAAAKPRDAPQRDPKVEAPKVDDGPRPETEWGHVVRRNFNKDPVAAAKEVKQVLAHVRGHLVECPIRFLEEEDIAKEGVGLNAFTETVYT